MSYRSRLTCLSQRKLCIHFPLPSVYIALILRFTFLYSGETRDVKDLWIITLIRLLCKTSILNLFCSSTPDTNYTLEKTKTLTVVKGSQWIIAKEQSHPIKHYHAAIFLFQVYLCGRAKEGFDQCISPGTWHCVVSAVSAQLYPPPKCFRGPPNGGL